VSTGGIPAATAFALQIDDADKKRRGYAASDHGPARDAAFEAVASDEIENLANFANQPTHVRPVIGIVAIRHDDEPTARHQCLSSVPRHNLSPPDGQRRRAVRDLN